MAELTAAGVETVVDLGCGDGKLLSRLLKERRFTRLVGLDVSARALEIAADRLHLDRLPPRLRERIHLLHGGLTYRDARIEGFDAATVIEVIEHLDENRLAAFERVFVPVRPAALGHRDHAERGIQRQLRISTCRSPAPSRSSVRVDSRRV